MKGRTYFESLGQRAASLGMPRWLWQHQTPDPSIGLLHWAVAAWIRGYDNRRRGALKD